MQILQTDFEILKACRRQLQNFLLLGPELTQRIVHHDSKTPLKHSKSLKQKTVVCL